jgi:hypothetical protein
VETFLVVLAVLGICGYLWYLAIRTAVRAARRIGRELTGRVVLVARAQGVGPQAEVARLRRDLDRSVGGARRALAAARTVHTPIGDVPSLLARLELAASTVEGELRVLEAHPGRERMAEQVAAAGSRVRAVESAAHDLVDGLLHAAGQGDELALLQTACAIEAQALRADVTGSRAATPSDDARDPVPPASTGTPLAGTSHVSAPGNVRPSGDGS